MGTETKGPSLVFYYSFSYTRKCQGADEYFLNKETWGRKQKDRPPGTPLAPLAHPKRTDPWHTPCHTHSPVCFHYAVISADRKLKPVEEHFLRIQAVRVLPDLPE